MLQQTITAPPGAPLSDPLETLGRGWLVLRNCRLGRQRDGVGLTALIHPRIGVLLLDRVPARLPGAVEAFRARLEAARFPAIFPGELPVVQLCLAPQDHERLGELLNGAFAGQPPFSLPGGDAWVAAATRALTTEPTMPGPQSRRLRTRRHRRLATPGRVLGLGALLLLALLGVLAATGGLRPEAPARVAGADAVAVATSPAATLPLRGILPAEPEPPPVPMPAGAGSEPSAVPAPAGPEPSGVPMPAGPEPSGVPAPALVEPPPGVAPPGMAPPETPAPERTVPERTVPERTTPRLAPPETPTPGTAASAGEPPRPDPPPDAVVPTAMPHPPAAILPPAERSSRAAAAGAETRSAASAARRSAAPRRTEAAEPAPPEPPPPVRSSPPSGRHQPEAATAAAAALPPIAAADPAPPPSVAAGPEPSPGRCRRILDQVFEGVLLPEEEMRFFNATCVRRRR